MWYRLLLAVVLLPLILLPLYVYLAPYKEQHPLYTLEARSLPPNPLEKNKSKSPYQESSKRTDIRFEAAVPNTSELDSTPVITQGPEDDNVEEGAGQVPTFDNRPPEMVIENYQPPPYTIDANSPANMKRSYDYYAQALEYMRDQRLGTAQKYLELAIECDPDNQTAEMALANIYLWRKDFCCATAIYSKYEGYYLADYGLARTALFAQDYPLAKKRFSALIEKYPDSVEVRRGYGRTLANMRDFEPAKKEFKSLLKRDKYDWAAWRDLYYAKDQIDPSVSIYSTYTMAKENDPDLKAPTVKNYYSTTKASLRFAVTDHWNWDLTGTYGYQKENDIYPPTGPNYDIHLGSFRAVSHFYFQDYFRWDLFAMALDGWGVGSNNAFPFEDQFYVLPGSSIVYQDGQQSFAANMNYETFIIKNFVTRFSQFLQTKKMALFYGYRFDNALSPKIEIWAEKTFIDDPLSNRRDAGSIWLQSGVPHFEDWMRLMLEIDYRSFAHITVNYYTYRRQIEKIFTVWLFHQWDNGVYMEFRWETGWKTSHRILQQIGRFLFFQNLQELTSNKFRFDMQKRVNDDFVLELGGHFFRDTLPYRDWNLHGSLKWQF
ncbi:MAG: hypothetical protein S4CHLAM102_15820 [Chlamydiia bacterium]|nr:hypothetical protein [Chlamydiia bacterium]